MSPDLDQSNNPIIPRFEFEDGFSFQLSPTNDTMLL